MRKTRSQTQAENALLSTNHITTTNNNNPQCNRAQSISSDSGVSSRSGNASLCGANKRHAPNDNTNNNYSLYPTMRDFEQMLQVLRVVELQQILSFVNIPNAGRKADLQRRILALLKTNFDLIAPKIQEISRQSIADQAGIGHFALPERMYSHLQMPHNMQANGGSMMSANGGHVSLAGNLHQQQQQQQQQQQHQQQQQQQLHQLAHNAAAAAAAASGAVTPFLHALSTQVPTHPDVRLKKLAFYDILGTLIKPSSLLPRNTNRSQEASFVFTLTPQQATEIASNRDIRNASKVEHVIQVQLRFSLVETSCEQEDCFPPSVSVKVNNKLCQLPNIIPTNRQNVEPKRPPRPINVTSHVKLSPTVANQIMVQWCPDYTRSFCLAVYLVKKLTSAQLLHRMKTKGIKAADYTRALIKEKLTEDADCEIATTMLKVSLICPLGKMKMSIPCRSSTCMHLQCFDGNLYLQMNERKPTWNCPVCDKPAVYDNLVIDGYFQEVLASPLLNSDDTEIQLHKDGSWSTHSLRNETQVLDTPSKPVQKVEVISDDIELITTDDVKPAKAGVIPAACTATAVESANDQPTSTTNSETVDLTLSDSDDDVPLAKRRSNRHLANGLLATLSTTTGNSVTTTATTTTVTSSMNGVAGNAGSGGGGGNHRGTYTPINNGSPITKQGRTIDTVSSRYLNESKTYVSYLSYHRPTLTVLNNVQQQPSQQQQSQLQQSQQQQSQHHLQQQQNDHQSTTYDEILSSTARAAIARNKNAQRQREYKARQKKKQQQQMCQQQQQQPILEEHTSLQEK